MGDGVGALWGMEAGPSGGGAGPVGVGRGLGLLSALTAPSDLLLGPPFGQEPGSLAGFSCCHHHPHRVGPQDT